MIKIWRFVKVLLSRLWQLPRFHAISNSSEVYHIKGNSQARISCVTFHSSRMIRAGYIIKAGRLVLYTGYTIPFLCSSPGTLGKLHLDYGPSEAFQMFSKLPYMFLSFTVNHDL